MKPLLKKTLAYVGYPAFYVFAIGASFHLTFPDERLKDRIEAEFDSRQPMGEGVRLEVGHASPSWFNGIEAEDLRFIDLNAEAQAEKAKEESRAAGAKAKPAASAKAAGSARALGTAKAPKDGDSGEVAAASAMAIDELSVNISLLKALVGIVAVSFDADAFGGTLSGEFSKSEEEQSVQLELDGVGVDGLPVLKDLVGLPMRGTLSGAVDVMMPERKLAQAEGSLNLIINDLRVGDGKAQILKAIALPLVDVGSIEIRAEVTAGVIRILKLSASGKDLDVEADGKIRLRDPLDRSLMELSLRFRFSDGYKNKNDMTRGLFGSNGIPGLLDLDPKVKRAKRDDGFYAWRVSGLMSKPSFLPESTRKPTTRRGASTKP